MAPEQFEGRGASTRTDIYAIGAVLYEAATGRRPFTEECASELMQSILHSHPPSPRGLNPAISPNLEAAILKCLEKEPENRYRLARELAADLRSLPAVVSPPPNAHIARKWTFAAAMVLPFVALTLLLGWNVGGWRDRLLHSGGAPRIQSLAVIPLANFSGDPQQEYFADGMTEELITELSRISALKVISRTSVMQYKGTKKRLPDIARELGVDGIIEGSVQREGEDVRITVQLLDGPNDRHLWAENYKRKLQGILALQGEVAQAIATEVRAKLNPQEQMRLASARQVNPEAHEAYLRGLYELHGIAAEPTEALKAQSIQKAIGYFQEAISHDSSDALAYSGLADAYYDLSTEYRAPLEVMPKAKAAALKAVELDDNLAEAHASLGYIDLSFDWDWNAAEREFRKALELNPNSPRAHSGFAEYLLFRRGYADESMEEFRRAYALDPLLPMAHGDLAWFLFLSRRYAEAVETARATGHGDNVLALAYAELGQRDLALAAADRGASSTKNPVILAQIAGAYALAGRADKARAMLPRIEGQARERYVCGFNVACVYSLLGDKEQAFTWLDNAYRNRSD